MDENISPVYALRQIPDGEILTAVVVSCGQTPFLLHEAIGLEVPGVLFGSYAQVCGRLVSIWRRSSVAACGCARSGAEGLPATEWG
jgi:hypothetical protein